MSSPTPRIAPLAPPYPPEIQAQFDRIMRGAPPLVLFRVMAGHTRAWDKFRVVAPARDRHRSHLCAQRLRI
jgi:hypothetical protein